MGGDGGVVVHHALSFLKSFWGMGGGGDLVRHTLRRPSGFSNGSNDLGTFENGYGHCMLRHGVAIMGIHTQSSAADSIFAPQPC